MPYLIAGLVAAAVAGAEQFHRLQSRFTLRNDLWVWWLVRMLSDGRVGAAAVSLLRMDIVNGPDNILGGSSQALGRPPFCVSACWTLAAVRTHTQSASRRPMSPYAP